LVTALQPSALMNSTNQHRLININKKTLTSYPTIHTWYLWGLITLICWPYRLAEIC